jgi:hypothetical protein
VDGIMTERKFSVYREPVNYFPRYYQEDIHIIYTITDGEITITDKIVLQYPQGEWASRMESEKEKIATSIDRMVIRAEKKYEEARRALDFLKSTAEKIGAKLEANIEA